MNSVSSSGRDFGIDMVGNVGIGTTGYGTYHGDTVVLGLGTGTTIRAANSGADPYVTMANNTYHDASAWKYIHADFASSYEQYNGTHVWNTAASGSAGATVPFAPRMKIDAAGDVLIGQTSQTGYAFAQKLVVGDGDNNDGITIQSGSTHQGNLAFNHSDGTTAHGRISYQHNTNYMQFFVNNSEKMRISSSGLVEIGQSYTANAHAPVLRLSGMSTSAYSGGLEWYSGYGPKTTAAMHSTASGSAGGEWWLQVRKQGTNTLVTALSINNAGAVLAGGGSSGGYVLNAQTSYGNWGVGPNNAAYCHYTTDRSMYYFNTACYASGGFHTYSDSRLKENVTAVTGALDKVALMNGVTFNWKNPETRGGNGTGKQFGVLAQNMLEVDSELPTLNDDPLSPEETRETDDSYYTMDYNRITPFLIEAIKELKTKLEAAEARIATLEG